MHSHQQEYIMHEGASVAYLRMVTTYCMNMNYVSMSSLEYIVSAYAGEAFGIVESFVALSSLWYRISITFGQCK